MNFQGISVDSQLVRYLIMKLKRCKKELGNELLNFHPHFQRKFKIHSRIKNA